MLLPPGRQAIHVTITQSFGIGDIAKAKNYSQGPNLDSFKLENLIISKIGIPDDIGILKKGSDVPPIYSNQFRFVKPEAFKGTQHKKSFVGLLTDLFHLSFPLEIVL